MINPPQKLFVIKLRGQEPFGFFFTIVECMKFMEKRDRERGYRVLRVSMRTGRARAALYVYAGGNY
jgi:hypothetical protein